MYAFICSFENMARTLTRTQFISGSMAIIGVFARWPPSERRKLPIRASNWPRTANRGSVFRMWQQRSCPSVER